MSFEFSETNLEKSKEIINRYPVGRSKSAVMPLLDLAQRQNNNYLSKDAISYIAKLLDISEIKVYEVATFYSMFNLKPIGKYLIQFCGTTPCALRGAKKLIEICKKELNIDINDISLDNFFSIKEVECLGACVNAPVAQINDDYYENLNKEKLISIITDLKAK